MDYCSYQDCSYQVCSNVNASDPTALGRGFAKNPSKKAERFDKDALSGIQAQGDLEEWPTAALVCSQDDRELPYVWSSDI